MISVLFSFKGISKKGLFLYIIYLFFAVQSESEIRFLHEQSYLKSFYDFFI